MVSEHRASPGTLLAHREAEIWILGSMVVLWLTLASPMSIQGQSEDSCDASHSNCLQISGKLCEIHGHFLLHPSQFPWVVREVQQSRLLCPCCTDTQECAVLKVRATWKLYVSQPNRIYDLLHSYGLHWSFNLVIIYNYICFLEWGGRGESNSTAATGLSNAQHHLRLEETSKQDMGLLFLYHHLLSDSSLGQMAGASASWFSSVKVTKRSRACAKMGEQEAERLEMNQRCLGVVELPKGSCVIAEAERTAGPGEGKSPLLSASAVLSLGRAVAKRESTGWTGRKATRNKRGVCISKGSERGWGGDKGGAAPSACARGRSCSTDKAQESIPRDSRWVNPRQHTPERRGSRSEHQGSAQPVSVLGAGTENKASPTCWDFSGTLSHFPAIHGLKASWVRHHAFVFCGPWHAFLLEIYFSCLWTHESFGMIIDKRSLDEKNYCNIKTDLAGFLQYDEKFMHTTQTFSLQYVYIYRNKKNPKIFKYW